LSHFCTQCGTKLIQDALFCSRCGAAIPEAFEEPESFSTQPPIPAEIAVEAADDLTEISIEPVCDNTDNTNDSPLADLTAYSDSVIPESTASEPERSDKRVLVALASILVSIVLFAVITAGQTWFVLKNGINNHTVKTAAKAVFDEVDIAEFPVAGVVDGSAVSIPEFPESPNVEEDVLYKAIFNTVDDYYKEIFGVDENHIKELLESEIFRGFISGIIDDYVDYIMGSDDIRVIASENIVSLIESNKDEIERITSYSLVESDFEDIRTVLQKSGLDNLTWDTAVGAGNDGLAVRNVFSILNRYPSIVLIAIITATVLLTALLIMLNRRRVSDTLLYFGITCVASGGVFLCGRVIGAYLLFDWIANKLGLGDTPAYAVQDAFSEAKNIIMISGISVIGTGLIIIAVRTIIKRATNYS